MNNCCWSADEVQVDTPSDQTQKVETAMKNTIHEKADDEVVARCLRWRRWARLCAERRTAIEGMLASALSVCSGAAAVSRASEHREGTSDRNEPYTASSRNATQSMEKRSTHESTTAERRQLTIERAGEGEAEKADRRERTRQREQPTREAMKYEREQWLYGSSGSRALTSVSSTASRERVCELNWSACYVFCVAWVIGSIGAGRGSSGLCISLPFVSLTFKRLVSVEV